jgi:hypothetical protein
VKKKKGPSGRYRIGKTVGKKEARSFDMESHLIELFFLKYFKCYIDLLSGI